MSFDTYTTLKAAVLDWLHRANLTAQVSDFVTLCEAEINRKLNIAPKEIDVPLVMVPASRFVVRPTDMSDPLALWLESYQPRVELTAKLPTTLPVTSVTSGPPRYWAIDGTNIAFEKPADQAYPLTFRYVQDTRLSDTNPTNELLRRSPDLYLYGCLAKAMLYTQNDARVALWKAEFTRILKDVRAEANRSKSVAPLMTEVPLSTVANTNICRRY